MNPLQHCLSDETGEIVNKLLCEFVKGCMGKNDMSVVNGLMATAAILIAAHCERTGDDFEEMSEMGRKMFAAALVVAGERI